MSIKTKKIIYWSIVGVLIAVILFSVGAIVHKLVTDAQDDQLYTDLANNKNQLAGTRPSIPAGPVTVPSTGNGSSDTTKPNQSSILPEYLESYNLNNDMVGWIQIPGTKIDYPVVQSKYQDNYYLRRNFYKNSATCGTIYAKETCNIDPASDNIVLYGHNMQNGTMFHDLINYKDRAYWENHRYIYFDTLTEYHTYEIFAVFTTTADPKVGFRYHIFNDTDSAAEFNSFVNQCKNLSYFDTGITPQYGEQFITLSTCDKTIGYGDNGRLVVVARRVV